MAVLIQWQNLWTVALPFFICMTTATIFTVLLWRVAFRSGLPHRREPCATCIFEGSLVKTGICKETCAVNIIPTLPLLLFLFTCTFALLFLVFPDIVLSYLLPPPQPSPASSHSLTWNEEWLQALVVVVAASNAGAAVLLTGYFVQDKAWHRELFFRVAVAGSLVGIVVGLLVPGPIGTFAVYVVPIGLVSVLMAVGLEHRARWGRPVLGLRALGVSTMPLFLVVLVALARILYILSAAYPKLI